jgi:Fe-Mn family superoxide dismutase
MIELCKLPYAYAALEPVISAKTMTVHHEKHHAAYVKRTNELAAKAGLDGLSVEDLAREAKARDNKKLYNNAAQVWNHGFFWQSMTGKPVQLTAELGSAIEKSFGDLPLLKKKFVEEGTNHFGSGWVWLASSDGGLKVLTTHDADDLLTGMREVPLLVCDLWEHAYYLDHQNDREGFLIQWFDHLANWDFAAWQLAAAAQGRLGYSYPMMAEQHA